MFNLITAISSAFAAQHASFRASQSAGSANVSSGTSAAASRSSATSAGAASQASAQAGNTSASTTSAASATAAQGSTPSASAATTTSASASGIASANVATSASTGRGATGTVAQSTSTKVAGIDRHFALGMQESAGAYAFDKLSRMISAGPDALSTAASLETAQKRFQSLVSQLATLAPRQANDDADSGSSEVATTRVQEAYAAAAA